MIDNKEYEKLAQKQPQYPTVQPAPVPTTFTVGQADFGDKKMVMLAISTPVGQAIYFLDGDSADGVAKALARIGTATKAGILVP